MFQELIEGDAVLARADARLCFAHVQDLLEALRAREAEQSRRDDGRLLTFAWSEEGRGAWCTVEWDRASGLFRMWGMDGVLMQDWSVSERVLIRLHDDRLGYFPLMWMMVCDPANEPSVIRKLEAYAKEDSEVLGVDCVEEMQVPEYLTEPRRVSEHVLCYGSVLLRDDVRD